MEILVVREPISEETLKTLAEAWHHTLVKGVVDIKTGVVALGGEWHMDANTRLLLEGSEQQNLWGFNLYPTEKGGKAIEYISLINIRPGQGNRSMEIESEEIRNQIKHIVSPIVPFLNL